MKIGDVVYVIVDPKTGRILYPYMHRMLEDDPVVANQVLKNMVDSYLMDSSADPTNKPEIRSVRLVAEKEGRE